MSQPLPPVGVVNINMLLQLHLQWCIPVLIYNKHFNSTTCKFHGTAVYGDLATISEKY